MMAGVRARYRHVRRCTGRFIFVGKNIERRSLNGWRATRVAGGLGMAAFGAQAETGVTNDAIIIGQSAAMSGPAGKLGQQMNLGAKLYFKSINAAGGIYGRKIELKVLDDFYENLV